MTTDPLLALVPWLLGGIALGAVYMHLISRTVAAIARPVSNRAAAGWLLLRFGLAAAVLALGAMQGAGPLLAALAGFLLSRTVAIRRAVGADRGR
ncbi:ATP synthase subunit I [Jannaschia seohaensis]|uniref:F1-F0 ATPase (N-ATPase) AtpR subunit n=1 Tax=Jannaschia seohaensis TaxID=475081 RepID=A0A2Y9ALQ4_9RHOB|nr:ATP synthase subunit I [Jannaschia seohaensis]PWJ20251.1 F1-F0 ATPase (N-ATPase) AtpR subunit [Jannaschia seohaensis]SSA44258.1 N-ATPase, AtpR subunit [Jannaschia seohaensis]